MMKPTAMTEKKRKRANQRRGRAGAHESTPGSQETDKGERDSQDKSAAIAGEKDWSWTKLLLLPPGVPRAEMRAATEQ
jgi:hypothetical protein